MNNLLVIAILFVAFYVFMNKGEGYDNLVNFTEQHGAAPRPSDVNAEAHMDVEGIKTNTDSVFCAPSPQMSSEDLLPKSDFMEWAKLHPSGKDELQNRNFLTSGHHIGINTVGQSLRNANYGIRSEPPNPQVPVSPWIQTTIGPDLNRRPLEIAENVIAKYDI